MSGDLRAHQQTFYNPFRLIITLCIEFDLLCLCNTVWFVKRGPVRPFFAGGGGVVFLMVNWFKKVIIDRLLNRLFSRSYHDVQVLRDIPLFSRHQPLTQIQCLHFSC